MNALHWQSGEKGWCPTTNETGIWMDHCHRRVDADGELHQRWGGSLPATAIDVDSKLAVEISP
jgi:hypothetical protein